MISDETMSPEFDTSSLDVPASQDSPAVDDSPAVNRDYFAFLVNKQRQPLFEAALQEQARCVQYFDSVPQLLMQCIKQPPLAVMTDLPTLVKIDKSFVNRLFDLGVNWPVMRCMITPQGVCRVHCHSPQRNTDLEEVFDEIAAGSGGWRNARFKRTHLRLKVQRCVELRATGQREWLRGNTMSLSSGGAMVLTFDAWDVGQQIELKILDLLEPTPVLHARIVRSSPWGNFDQLPCIGVQFDPSSVPDGLLHKIASPEFLSGKSNDQIGGIR